jgi:hypothetical protein
MRSKLASAAIALVAFAAAPSALASGTVTIAPGLVDTLRVSTAATEVVRKDNRRSCQAGASRSRVRLPGPSSAGETERRASAVACEQPPRSQPNLSGALSSAETGAIATAG